jgi:hypothetical protein
MCINACTENQDKEKEVRKVPRVKLHMVRGSRSQDLNHPFNRPHTYTKPFSISTFITGLVVISAKTSLSSKLFNTNKYIITLSICESL